MLITEGSEERRKLMDSIISQYDRDYLDALINYNKVLSQRNALLKHFAQSRFDAASLEIWDEQLVPLAEKIYDRRLKFINEFTPIFKKHYASLSGGNEEVQLEYESHLHRGNFKDILKTVLDRDRALQYSTAGIHKDDLHFLISGYPAKRFASQGQQKSFLIAVKLAQFDFIREIKKLKPLLLLDDIFDKLDESRMRSLLQMISHHDFGQIFLTDTHPDRAKKIFDSIHVPVKLFHIEQAAIRSSSKQ
jgi:DNA replication and repair protein RecF